MHTFFAHIYKGKHVHQNTKNYVLTAHKMLLLVVELLILSSALGKLNVCKAFSIDVFVVNFNRKSLICCFETYLLKNCNATFSPSAKPTTTPHQNKCGRVHITISSLNNSLIELNWITNCNSTPPAVISLFNQNPAASVVSHWFPWKNSIYVIDCYRRSPWIASRLLITHRDSIKPAWNFRIPSCLEAGNTVRI